MNVKRNVKSDEICMSMLHNLLHNFLDATQVEEF